SKPGLQPPIVPMLAKVADALPPEGDVLYEPKWDGFRALVFADGKSLYLQSRDGKPLDRYFPDLHAALPGRLPVRCVLDGEIVIATPSGLDFDALQLRLHPAASRVAMLANRTPAAFVAFDILELGSRNLMAVPQEERRALLGELLADTRPPLYLTPVTRKRKVALDWLARFEGAGLDGVIAKSASSPYLPGQRAMLKIKHVRTADCVVAGFRFHRSGEDAVGSLLLGLFDDAGVLQHVGVTSSFTMAARRALLQELGPLRRNALRNHPWREWQGDAAASSRMPGGR